MILKYSLVPLFLVLVLGCSKSENKTTNASVSGEVTFNGKLVKGGSVTFYGEGTLSHSSPISADGSYAISGLPAGDMVVTIETESVAGKGQAQDSGEGNAKKYRGSSSTPDEAKRKTANYEYTKIPERYSNKNRSGLTATLTSGRNTKNFDLTD